MNAAVVLLSGGLDSATVLAIAKQNASPITALSFDYGQRHRFELTAAKIIAKHLNANQHLILNIDTRAVAASALTDPTIPVPKHNPQQTTTNEISAGDIPATYVPARNTIFLAHALGLAECINATEIYLGVNALDYSGYPDCRPEFIHAFQNLANLATKSATEGTPIKIIAPLINMTKAQIIKTGTTLGVDYSLTHSCYDPDPDSGAACGQSPSSARRWRDAERGCG